MNAPTLLDELIAAGIRLGRDGNDLIADVLPTADLSPYTAHIRAHKPALLRELLQRQIVAALDVAPADFDRDAYDRLWVLWHAHDAKEESTP